MTLNYVTVITVCRISEFDISTKHCANMQSIWPDISLLPLFSICLKLLLYFKSCLVPFGSMKVKSLQKVIDDWHCLQRWWPFPGLSPRSALFIFVWPVFVVWFMRYLSARRWVNEYVVLLWSRLQYSMMLSFMMLIWQKYVSQSEWYLLANIVLFTFVECCLVLYYLLYCKRIE